LFFKAIKGRYKILRNTSYNPYLKNEGVCQVEI